MSDIDTERELANYLLDPHRPLDETTKNIPSQPAVDENGVLRVGHTNDHGEIASFGAESDLLPDHWRKNVQHGS